MAYSSSLNATANIDAHLDVVTVSSISSCLCVCVCVWTHLILDWPVTTHPGDGTVVTPVANQADVMQEMTT